MADDNCVNVTGRNPRTEFLPVLGFKILFGGHKQVGGRVELEPLGGKLLYDVVWNHNHGFVAESQPLALHRRRNHRISFPGSHHIGKQAVPPVNDAGSPVFLVLP